MDGRTTELPDNLAKCTGNDCLSNLLEYIDILHFDMVIANIPLYMFSEAQWHQAAEYMTGKELNPTPLFELCELLIE